MFESEHRELIILERVLSQPHDVLEGRKAGDGVLEVNGALIRRLRLALNSGSKLN